MCTMYYTISPIHIDIQTGLGHTLHIHRYNSFPKQKYTQIWQGLPSYQSSYSLEDYHTLFIHFWLAAQFHLQGQTCMAFVKNYLSFLHDFFQGI